MHNITLMTRCWCWWRCWRRMNVMAVVIVAIISVTIKGVVSDPQTNLLNEECSQFKTNDLQNFFTDFNTTFDNIRRQLLVSNTYFATAYQTKVFGMAQCRRYLSGEDCVACFDAGVKVMRQKCPDYDGAHVVYDGCFLR